MPTPSPTDGNRARHQWKKLSETWRQGHRLNNKRDQEEREFHRYRKPVQNLYSRSTSRSRQSSPHRSTHGDREPSHRQLTTVARNRIQSRVQFDDERRGHGFNNSRASSNNRNGQRPWSNSNGPRHRVRPFRSRDDYDVESSRRGRSRPWSESPSSRRPFRYRDDDDERYDGNYRSKDSPSSGVNRRQRFHDDYDHEAEIQRLRDALLDEAREKQRLKLNLRYAQSLVGGDSTRSPYGSHRSRGLRGLARFAPWSRSTDSHSRYPSRYGSPRSLPVTPPGFYHSPSRSRPHRDNFGHDFGTRRFPTPRDRYGYREDPRGEMYGPPNEYYDSDINYLNDYSYRKSRRNKYRRRGWKSSGRESAWLCFPFYHRRKELRALREVEELRRNNQRLAAQLQGFEEGQALKKQGRILEVEDSLQREAQTLDGVTAANDPPIGEGQKFNTVSGDAIVTETQTIPAPSG